MQRLVRTAFCATSALAAGCYSFRPLDPGTTLLPGAEIRARLSASAPDATGIRGGRNAGGEQLRGHLVRWATDTLSISVAQFGPLPLSDTLAIPLDRVSTVEVWHIDTKRTAITVGVAAVVAGVIAWNQFGGNPPRFRPPEDDGNDLRFPPFRVRFPR
ncbi:MAG: hypothetical protein ACREMQ_15175 [Longimicrobiales bacterium]